MALAEGLVARVVAEPSIEVTEEMALAMSGRWFLSREEARVVARLQPVEAVLHDADRCVRHEFNVLGTGARTWGPSLPWHQDTQSRRTWPRRYHKCLRYDLTGKGGSDVKVPWELSRCQHLIALVKAYVIDSDPVYARAAAGDIADWLEQNPFGYGVNWTCAMEVAIRACNWLWAWWAFSDDPSWSPDFRHAVVRSLWQHAWYIEHNLEDANDIRTNHYLADIIGLLFISVMLPALPEAPARQKFAVQELVRCMDEMVYNDGTSFENSTSYQRLVMDLFVASAVLCRCNGIQLPGRFWERLERMFVFVNGCSRPDGRMPMVGDADDGRLFALEGYADWDRWDFRYLLSVGAVLFRRVDFKQTAGRRHAAMEWLFGPEGVAVWEAL